MSQGVWAGVFSPSCSRVATRRVAREARFFEGGTSEARRHQTTPTTRTSLPEARLPGAGAARGGAAPRPREASLGVASRRSPEDGKVLPEPRRVRQARIGIKRRMKTNFRRRMIDGRTEGLL